MSDRAEPGLLEDQVGRAIVQRRLEALRKVEAEPCERPIEPGEELFRPSVEMLEIGQPAPALRDVDQLVVRR